jgi:predicted RNase H-like HicB family nuclease
MELIFEVRDAEEGGYWARALGHAIFTEGETWDELRSNVREAILNEVAQMSQSQLTRLLPSPELLTYSVS